MKKKKSSNIVRYPKSLNINIGVIFFALIFIYLAFNVYSYATAVHVSYYEVDNGSIRIRTDYTGLALRSERVVYASESGYVNYYLKDGSRAKAGSLVCSIDENGDIADRISEAGDAGGLDASAYGELAEEMRDYCQDYDDMAYYTTYTFKDDLEAELMEYINLGALSSMSDYAANAESSHTFHRVKADAPGIVSYYCDGYEDVTADSFTPAMLDESGYEKNNRKAVANVEEGDPLFKLVTSEDWQVVFEIDSGLKSLLADDSVIKVRFKSDETTAWANYETVERGGAHYLVLNFNNSMIRYASDRFVDVELMLDKQYGLKIPNQSIVEKDFFLVPTKYFTRGGNSNSLGLLVEMTDDDGEKVQKFIATDIYFSTEECYYVSEDALSTGTSVIDPAGGDSFTISDTAKLKGVYNINKGYAVFRVIDILSQNEEYSIVARGTDYGLSQYDHIALDGSLVSENQIVNR